MLAMSGDARIFLFVEAVDMRKGFEGLSLVVEMHFADELTSGAYFVFLNRRRDRMKVLYWDADGLVIWYKRLERGAFHFTQIKNKLLDRRSFLMLLEGIVPKRLHKRYTIT
tara:strand:+ start:508 stop:840 length:333 start_codon:yes stop_codon:yes gene_type:complete